MRPISRFEGKSTSPVDRLLRGVSWWGHRNNISKERALTTLPWANEPVVVMTYGPSGVGKTTDMGYSFPRALFIAAPGALTSIRSVCGYEPTRIWVDTLSAATDLIEAASGKYQTVVIDDFSFLAEQTFSTLEKKYSGFRLWGELRDTALTFRDKARMSGVNVVFNCWEQPPKIKHDGARVRGGPMLSGRTSRANSCSM